jgi:signal transduction histidine kinase
MRDLKSKEVIGVVEVYRIPDALYHAIDAGTRLIWMIAIGAGAFLYLTLFWIVRRADQVIRSQQERLIESETMGALGEMASAVAHGIRNPLASIRSSAELWQEDAGDIGVESATDIISEVHRIELWIRELLTYSQPCDYKAEAVDSRPLIEQCIAGFARETKRRQVTIESTLPNEFPKVQANASLLMQVLNNLISNALEAMPAEGGKIVIAGSTSAANKHVDIRISDTGSGIAPVDMGKIYQPFFTTKAKGLGVGLTLVRRIVKRFGGSIQIASTPGKGTVITLNFLTA